jgi:hypothetical protein
MGAGNHDFKQSISPVAKAYHLLPFVLHKLRSSPTLFLCTERLTRSRSETKRAEGCRAAGEVERGFGSGVECKPARMFLSRRFVCAVLG